MSRDVINLSTLSPTQGFIIQGDTAYDRAGWSVSAAGDVNGDGFDDLITGAPRGGDGGDWAGEAYVLFGGAGGFGTAVGGRQVVDLTTLTAAQGFIIQGDAAGDWTGYSVSTAGDINGDGFDDVIAGAPRGGDGGYWAGEAYVLFGGAGSFGEAVGGRQVVDLTTLSGAQGFVIQGDAVRDSAGFSVSSAGDVDGDGFGDMIVGAPFNSDRGRYAGEAYVLFGGADGFGTTVGGRQMVDLTTLSPGQGFVIQGNTAFGFAGMAVSDAGDVNGDGFGDMIVGAPFMDAGKAYVLFGGAGGFGTTVHGRQIVDLATLTGAQGFVIQGNATSDHAGWSVSDAGDVNGDGFGDLIVGAPYGDDGGDFAGEAYVLFGGAGGFGTTVGDQQVVDLSTLTAAQGFIIQGEGHFFRGYAGRSVSSAGDINGDGFDDVIVDAYHAGKVYVLFGSATGFGTAIGGRQVVDLATLTSAQGFVIQGDARGSVSAAGDVNGDGFADVIVGAPFGAAAGTDAGEGYVVFGGNFTHAVASAGTAGDDLTNSGPTGQTIFGAQGDDTLFGNRGADSLNGGSGSDSLNGGADADTIASGSGDDIAVGGDGDDRALGGDGADTLSGRAGADTLLGEANDDRLVGNAGNDSLDGGQGHDHLFGGDGVDTLTGGRRGDALVGGAGADVLGGGTGHDRFVFAAGSSSPGAPDTITDFEADIDKLVIRGGVDHGTFLGGGAFTGSGGIEVRWDTLLHQLQVDLNGDGGLGANDLAITGQSLATLTAHDLLFI